MKADGDVTMTTVPMTTTDDVNFTGLIGPKLPEKGVRPGMFVLILNSFVSVT